MVVVAEEVVAVVAAAVVAEEVAAVVAVAVVMFSYSVVQD